MTLHGIDIACSKDSGQAFVGDGGWIETWLTNLIAWSPDGDLTVSNDPPTLTRTGLLAETGTQYYKGGIWWFDWGSRDKDILLDNLQGQADAYCPWYRIRWHECHNDNADDESFNCQWDEIRTKGTIPDGV